MRKDQNKIKKDYEYVYGLFPRLKERENQLAGTLSGGEQQMLAVGRGIMMDPKILMMDEPSLGLAPIVVNSIFEIIRQINADGRTILLVEQNSNAALSVAHRGYVVETGHIVMSDTAENLRKSEEVKKRIWDWNERQRKCFVMGLLNCLNSDFGKDDHIFKSSYTNGRMAKSFWFSVDWRTASLSAVSFANCSKESRGMDTCFARPAIRTVLR